MRLFYLDREQDVSGVSGVGRVAEGVCFDDGQCVLRWLCGEVHSTVIYKTVDEMQKIHGHGGATKIVFIGEEINAFNDKGND